MFFKQFYLGCLAHASYLIGSKGLACVVDPQRDIQEYLRIAQREGLTVKYIIETHVHADFVSGHKELAQATGAQIIFGSKAKLEFEHKAVKDNETITLGDLELTFLETPGHTPESICILVKDLAAGEIEAEVDTTSSASMKLLTGDTLFIGDVGRPDLVAAYGIGPEDMAGMLYDSLHQKILTLPEETEIYPAHGAGSLCGKNISKENTSTLALQKKFNWALRPMGKEEFVGLLTTDLPEVPGYFSVAVATNKQGAINVEDIPKPEKFTADQVIEKCKEGYVILDTRKAACFAEGHIPGSINIGLDGQFASWCGIMFDCSTKFIIVPQFDYDLEEVVVRLARAGMENARGTITIQDWQEQQKEIPLQTLPTISPRELSKLLNEKPDLKVLDVRRPGEFQQGHVAGARNISLAELPKKLASLEKNDWHLICLGGYRSSMAASLLLKEGFTDIVSTEGGTAAWKSEGLPLTVESQSVACTSPKSSCS